MADVAASKLFYSLALGEPTHDDKWITEWGNFGIAPANAERPVSAGLHVGFGAQDREEVDRWWADLTAAGYESDGAPGIRPWYHETYYGAFVRDPDGHSVEAVHHHLTDAGATRIDHLWLRTASVEAAKRFYEAIAPVVGIELVHDTPDWVRFRGGPESFSFVHGDEPTTNVHLAFGVSGQPVVDEFHRIATSAGYADNGAPGERRQYHPGYYGAFVLDPDGHNIEAVFHDRG